MATIFQKMFLKKPFYTLATYSNQKTNLTIQSKRSTLLTIKKMKKTCDKIISFFKIICNNVKFYKKNIGLCVF
jgi:hypothetical protein